MLRSNANKTASSLSKPFRESFEKARRNMLGNHDRHGKILMQIGQHGLQYSWTARGGANGDNMDVRCPGTATRLCCRTRSAFLPIGETAMSSPAPDHFHFRHGLYGLDESSGG